MKIVSGIYGSRSIKAPKGNNTRPTMNNVKEAMFNIIGDRVENAVCLDLFSGSGQLGIEALSRGASKVYFNDFNYDAFQCIKENLLTLKIDKANYKLTKKNYSSLLEEFDVKFDIVFLDPPYKEKIYEDIVNKLIEKNLLNLNPIIICEADLVLEEFPINGLKCKEYKYGTKKLLVYC